MGRGKGVVGEVFGRHPADRWVAPSFGAAAGSGAGVGGEVNATTHDTVSKRREFRADNGVEAEVG